MNELFAGFARLTITPPLGTKMAGYFVERRSDGILDDLEVNTVALSDGDHTAVLLSLDIVYIPTAQADLFRCRIAEENHLSPDAVFIACTHTHTGPFTGESGEPYYNEWLACKLSDSVRLAIGDLKPSSVGIGTARAGNVSFIRRYRMKDGTIRTNPGVGNPDIVAPVGQPNDAVQVVRITREGADEIVLIHFQVHPDTIGGCKISADYPRFVRETLEKALSGVKAVYFNGAQGDSNHVNVNAKKGDLNGLELDSFDDVARGYEHAKHMGRSIAGAVLSVYGKTEAVAAGAVQFARKQIRVPSNRPDPSQLPLAEKYIALHSSGRDDEIPFRGMELTTVVAEALRMKRLEKGPDEFALGLTVISFGPVALVGIPGEPFTRVGLRVTQESPYPMTFTCCLTNGAEGYFPTRDAYAEGGYEARSSNYGEGVAEAIGDASIALLKAMAAES